MKQKNNNKNKNLGTFLVFVIAGNARRDVF
jgi:hypothetical protein